jgi:hypothetical protein
MNNRSVGLRWLPPRTRIRGKPTIQLLRFSRKPNKLENSSRTSEASCLSPFLDLSDDCL